MTRVKDHLTLFLPGPKPWPDMAQLPNWSKNHHESNSKKTHNQSIAQGQKSNYPKGQNQKTQNYTSWGVRSTCQKCMHHILNF